MVYYLLDFILSVVRSMLDLLHFKENSNSLIIYVQTNNGNKLCVALNPKWDIKSVKEVVGLKLGLPSEELKIIFAGRELSDSTILEECDLGQRSILHAVKVRSKADNFQKGSCSNISEKQPCKPLFKTFDFQLEESSGKSALFNEDPERSRTNFFVFCSQCQKMCIGKLRVRCARCKSGAFTVFRDPDCWDDVLKTRKIHGNCESSSIDCVNNKEGDSPFAEFYFKCAEHLSGGEGDFSAPLNLIRRNINNVPCLGCSDVSNIVLIFPCAVKHVTCIDCFRYYCLSRLMERQFVQHTKVGYTLPCPAGCENSFIEEIHHFKLLQKEDYDRYQRFATEEFVIQSGGVLCPQPGCGMGLLFELDCTKITCQGGCGYVFCRMCLQGYHLGKCQIENYFSSSNKGSEYTVDPLKAAEACWDEASNITIKVISKPCPKCRTPTEKDGGCMHMICTRAGCGFEWCWICQTSWTRDCMGSHWFG